MVANADDLHLTPLDRNKEIKITCFADNDSFELLSLRGHMYI